MGLMRLGVLSALLSESLISGFTTGAAFHVVTTQVPHIFGFRIQKFIGPGRLVKVNYAKSILIISPLLSPLINVAMP